MSEPLREALLLYRARFVVDDDPTVGEGNLDALERELGGLLPEELVAFFAASASPISRIVQLTEAAEKRGLDPGYAVFEKGEQGLWCVELGGRARRREAPVGRWVPGEGEPFLDRSLTRYLRERFDLTECTDEEIARARVAAMGFTPGVLVPLAPKLLHVSHPKFGDGVVVQEIRDGNHKLVVDFPDGRRTLLARFLVPRAVAA